MLGGERAAQEYRIMQARDVWVLPAAIDPHEFQPMAAAIEYHADLLFVGNPTYGREAGLKRFFFDVARLCPQNHFLLSGADWTGVELPDNTRYLGYVPSQRLAQLYCSARLVLNVTREEMASYGDAAALRLFEAAACEACLVSDKWSGLDQLFSPEHEILLVDRTDDVVRYLTNVDWQTSRAIGRRARERVMSEHTAEIRLSQFLDLIGMS